MQRCIRHTCFVHVCYRDVYLDANYKFRNSYTHNLLRVDIILDFESIYFARRSYFAHDLNMIIMEVIVRILFSAECALQRC